MTFDLRQVAALTLDLDDTLWPVRPTLVAAEQVLAHWLQAHAPDTARGMAPGAMLALRAQVAAEHPHWAHDLSAIRLETIRRALRRHGDDPALAEAAFEVFFEARHRVTLYDDVLPGLERLAARYRLVAVSNGNAELARVGLGRWFSGSVSARLHGVAKPDPSIFLAACGAACAASQAARKIDGSGLATPCRRAETEPEKKRSSPIRCTSALPLLTATSR